jgi:hypothetical protein
LLVGVPVAATALVVAAGLVPDRLILDSLLDGVERQEILNVPQVGISGRGLDVFSDCIALTMGLGDSDGGPLTIGLRSPTLGSCDGAIMSLQGYEQGAGLSGGYEYFRYWHGYTVFSRPAVALFGVAGARSLLLWAVVAALGLFAHRLRRFHGWIAPLALLGPFLLTTDSIELTRSLPHGVPLLVSVLGALAIHIAASGRPASCATASRASDDLRLATVAFLAGSAFVFADLLTNSPGAWALATAMAGLASIDRFTCGRLAMRSALVAGSWIVGWVWTWVTKWVVAAAVVGIDRVRESVGDAVEDRVAGERDYIDLAPLNAIEANLRAWWEHPLTPAVVVAVALATLYRWRRPDHRATWRTRLILAAPAAMPLVWFEVLRNHSLVHVGFVYRSVGVSAGVVALALLVDVPAQRRGSPSTPITNEPSTSSAPTATAVTDGMTIRIVSDGSSPPKDSDPHTATATTDPAIPATTSSRPATRTRSRLSRCSQRVRLSLSGSRRASTA